MAWVATAVIGAGVVGAIASNDSARHNANVQEDIAKSAQAGNDKALDAQVRQADELLAFNKQQYEEGKQRQAGIDAINSRVVNQNLDLMQKAGQRADDAYNFYTQNGRPLVQKTLDEANNFDSAGNIAAARQRAAADVQQGFDNAQQQSQRALTRMGVNPSSGRFLALQQSLQAQKALGLAGAKTNAETNVRGQAIQMRQQASNLAQGFPAQSMGQAGQSSGTGVAAAGVAGASAAQNNALTQQAMAGMNTGANIYGNVAAGYQNAANSAYNQVNNINQQAAQSQAGWGSLFGMGLAMLPGMADGGDVGKVKGPGTGTSDSVPAVNTSTGQPLRLSNDEFIIPADVVRKLGTKHFEKMIEQYHTPVNLGRSQ